METTIVYWGYIWVVVQIMVPFWIPIIIRHLISRDPKRDHNFDNHPYYYYYYYSSIATISSITIISLMILIITITITSIITILGQVTASAVSNRTNPLLCCHGHVFSLCTYIGFRV